MTTTDGSGRPGLVARIERGCLNLLAALVVALAPCIGVQVLASAAGLDPLASFDPELFLLGDALSINTLLDLQWHLLSLIALLPAWIVWRRDRHVRVDFLYSRFGPAGKRRIDALGHLLLSLPFLLFCLPASWSFARRAFDTAERASNGGMSDRWVVKGALVLGLALLLATVLADLVGALRDARCAGKGDAA